MNDLKTFGEKNVRLHGDKAILMCHPADTYGLDEIRTLFQRVAELRREHDREFLIVDLTTASRPDAATRKVLTQESKIIRNFKHVAIFTGKNIIINTVARFVFSSVYDSYSVHKSLRDAEKAIENAAI